MNDLIAGSDPATAEDEAFDEAFQKAAERELSMPGSLFPAHSARPPPSPELLARRNQYRRMVLFIVGAAAAVTLVALAIGVVT